MRERVRRGDEPERGGGREHHADAEPLRPVRGPPGERLRREAPPALPDEAAPERERQQQELEGRHERRGVGRRARRPAQAAVRVRPQPPRREPTSGRERRLQEEKKVERAVVAARALDLRCGKEAR